MNANLYAELESRFGSAADHPFLSVPHGESHTYRAMADRSARLAAVLAELGVAPGDRVVVQVDKSVENVALYLACLRHGAVYVPLNPAYTPDEVEFFVEDARPALAVCDPARPAPSRRGRPVLTLAADGHGTLEAAADMAEPAEGIANREPDDLAAIVYTSGTTGRPKGAMLSHRNLVSNALTLHQLWRFEPGDVMLHTLPLFHVHGLMVALHTAMSNASEVIFLHRFDVESVIEQLPRTTVMMGVPTYFTRLLDDDRVDPHLTAGVRLFISGSAPLTKAVHEEFWSRTRHRILERYGMSETGMITSNPYDGDRVAGTVGFALPDVNVRVCDADGVAVETGQTGVVEVRGPNVFAGYWNQPERSAKEIRPDGHFVTGDVGRVDAEGRLSLEGRASDMIITGGLNVYPKGIELQLDDCPGVSESAVVGLPHADLGEAVTAFIVTVGDQTMRSIALTEALDGLARFKHPKRYVELNALPRNSMGKVQKTVLRETHADLYD